MVIHESAEDYLENILILTNKNGKVKSIDIANYMNYSKPSISRAMKNLKNDGYIIVDENGYITLTDKGKKIAINIYERHVTLSNWFKSIGVSEENALNDACRIEHYLSHETYNAIKKYIDNLDK
ncbi:metal-dependent transcriptional regulator [bacterium]|nr:metal-dependent transcriptional regulator [bacterium]